MVNKTVSQKSWSNNLGWRHGRNGLVRTQASYDRLREHMRQDARKQLSKKILEEKKKAQRMGQRYLSPIQKKVGARIIA